MLVGLYGGTFDPVHTGHIHAAMAAKLELQLDQVRMVLAARPGHRSQPGASVRHRWQMLKLACAQHPDLIPDDTEAQREGASYTIDTVSELFNNGDIPVWIMGQDAFATLPIWYRWQELLTVCNLAVVSRPGDERPEPPEVQALCSECEVEKLDAARIGQIYRLQAPMLELSATQVRTCLAENRSTQDLLATPVSTYITQHALYHSRINDGG